MSDSKLLRYFLVHRKELRYAVLASLIFALANVLNSRSAYAEDSTSSQSLWQTIVSDLEVTGTTTLTFFSGPARGSATDYLYALGGGAVITGFIALDDKTSPAIRDARMLDSEPLESILSYSKNWGERDYAIAGVATGYLAGLITGEESVRTVSRLCAESLLFSAVITGTGKILAGRARPSQDNAVSKWDWNIWETHDSRHSFPSGHTTVAFALSSVLAEEIDGWAFDASIYTLASLTALSRVDDGRHWLADVVTGAAIGTLCGLYVTSEDHKRNSEDKKEEGTSWMLAPSLNGLTFSYTF